MTECGHLRVYHAAGLPEGKFDERPGDCLFCTIRRLEARLSRIGGTTDVRLIWRIAAGLEDR